MPSNKKKGTSSKKKVQDRRAKQSASQDFHTVATEFRELLLKGREEYAKGRSYAAVEKQSEALKLGSEKIPRFGDSLTKAHALIELALAKSAIQTDFATGEEWNKLNQEGKEISSEALQIFERRISSGTLTRFRKEECWIDGSDYSSAVPHTERLGPIDYTQCININNMYGPSESTIRSIKKAIMFCTGFISSGYVINLEAGGALQGGLPDGIIETLSTNLQQHESVVRGEISARDAMENMYGNDDREEVRHTGSLMGKMKLTHKKLAKDTDKIGLKHCSNPNCDKVETHPKQFMLCSRCNWSAYCGRDCQVSDWKIHKKNCKELATKVQEEKTQNKTKASLQVGESQRVLTIIRAFHHFAVAMSKEMEETDTEEAHLVEYMVKPKLESAQLGSVQLGMQEVAFVWSAIWSMEKKDRNKMIRKFLSKMDSYQLPRPSPDFGVVKEWGESGVYGIFAVVKYTEKGTIMLHEEQESNIIKGYMAVGLTQPVEDLLAAIPQPLPLFLNTALIPFKKVVLCQGTIMPALGNLSPKLEAAAKAFVDGSDVDIEIIERM